MFTSRSRRAKKKLADDAISRIEDKISALERYDPAVFREPEPSELSILAYGILEVLETTFGRGSAAFDRFSKAARLGARPLPAASDRTGVERHRRDVVENIRRSQAILREAMDYLKREGPSPTSPGADAARHPRPAESLLDRIGKPLAIGASVATITGVTLFGSASGWTILRERWAQIVPGSGSDTPAAVKPAAGASKEGAAAPTPADTDPQTCAKLAKGAAEAAEQGFLLKAEQLQRMMADMSCRRAAAP